ncbi:hypothetical protein [Bacillus tuaregi]|uniref:hypothetical protein n=1 Tax=Bacillus tuaregi TaxID=1816695 RepID=UPI0008F9514E|nr:hypothetical protein [Bacillus tuaregi]
MLKKWLLFGGFLVLFVLVSGCGTADGMSSDELSAELAKYDVVNSKSEVQNGDFIYRLVSEQKEYPNGQSVILFAELEYVGDQAEITIQHAASPFYFPMVEKIRGFDISYPMPEPLISTTLKKGEPLRIQYTGSGAYSEEDEMEFVKFMKDFMENGFPTGYYVVNGYADFLVPKEDPNQAPEKVLLEAQVDFKVK